MKKQEKCKKCKKSDCDLYTENNFLEQTLDWFCKDCFNAGLRRMFELMEEKEKNKE